MSHGHILVIGGGGTGAAIAHDLTLRGFTVTLVERGEFTSGTTGRHHGQLHSGARYAVGDRQIARECMDEVRILRQIATDSIEMNFGLFVALNENDEAFTDEFIAACRESTIPAKEVSVQRALAMEPSLNPDIVRAVQVPDGTIDAWRLPLRFLATAKKNGAMIRNFCELVAFEIENGMIVGADVTDLRTGRVERIRADAVVSATGAWAGLVARKAGVDMPVTPAPGTMVAVKRRLNNMVVSHLHRAGDGDIIVPQRGLSIIGSTQWTTDDPDTVEVPEEDIEYLLRRADELIPSFSQTPFHAAWSACRPLAGSAADADGGRELSRDFSVIDHGARDRVSGFLSVVGGKATVLRGMAEKTGDVICDLFGVRERCRTATVPLLPHRAFYNPALVSPPTERA